MAAVAAAEEDREQVADQFAATVGEDRRPFDEAGSVLLAAVSRRPSDTPGVRGDSAADLAVAVTSRVWEELSDNWAETRPSFWSTPISKGYRPRCIW